MSERGRSPGPSGGGSRPPTRQSGSPHGSSGSRATSASRRVAPSWPQGPGYDPAKPATQPDKGNTRMELPPDAYLSGQNKDVFALRGNKFNNDGSTAVVQVNQYRMKKFNMSKKIHQYDVVLSPDTEKKSVVLKKVWNNSATKTALRKYNYNTWIFDGRKLAWAPGLVDRGEIRFTVDLDEGQRPPGAPAREGAKFHVTIRATTEVHIAALQGYLDRKIQFNTSVEVAMNFMDHLIRQWPSQHMVAIKRNFYNQSDRSRPLLDGHVVEVHKGIYASVRMSHNLAQGGTGLALNVDVANTCFWTGPQPVDQLMCHFLGLCDKKWKGVSPSNVGNLLRPVRGRDGQWQSSDAFKHLRKMRKLRFTVKHAGRTAAADKIYTIEDFAFNQKYGPEGGTAKMVTFDYDGRETSVESYFQRKYRAHLKHANLPVISVGKGGYIPMEFAIIEPMQRYAFKLTPEQTAAMIKIAVTRPPQRRADIEKSFQNLQHQADPYLKEYGVEFESAFTKTQARVLPPPPVNFGHGTADPKFSGRWDLRGKKFWKQNVAPLQNWAFIVMDNCVQHDRLQMFAKTFRHTFLTHGGKCPSEALLLNVPGDARQDIAQAMAWAHGQIVQQRGYTQLLFVVVGFKNSPHYERIKKSADCRFGILSQVVNAAAVANNNGQYHSNVCMKVNAKLGGATSRTMPPWKLQQKTYFPKDRPTMIIGVDISHASRDTGRSSTAAMTMAVDRDANRYAASVETNGYRVEILTAANVHFMFGQLSKQWMAGHENAFPKHIMYFRDGVAEGQFAQVLDQEIREIKSYLRNKAPNMPLPKFTVIVATKRHHIRFFPERGDKNGNALPGTLVEREVTHPFMFDFYLCSHVAIQGTARPVHYHVLLDEMNVPVNDLQKMIYHQCYSYARSTTPVSLHPAVYYAHLAGARAVYHENVASSEGPRAGAKGHEMNRDLVAKGASLGGPRGTDAPPLLPLGGRPEAGRAPAEGEMRQRDFFRGTMWYI